jgi:ethanolamine utilization microcompartment shell protein EutS
MRKQMMGLAFCIAVFAMSAAAQNTFPASGNVGIGTTAPPSTLSVAGDIGINAGSYLRAISGSNTNLNYIQMYDGNGGMNFFTYYGIGVPTQGYFNFYTASSTKPTMNINSNGNVGIGTMAPAEKLEVAGNIALKAGEDIWISTRDAYNLVLNGANDAGTSGKGVQINYYNGSAWFKALESDNVASGYNNLLLQQSGGNVGIGTTSPGSKLEVNGNLKLTAGSGASITFQDGTTQSTAFTGVLCGGDYAESVDVTGDRTNYAPGDVLVLDTDNPGKVLKSIEAYSTAVAGIYSTKPGAVGRRQTTAMTPDEVPMAMVGVVPAKVTAENGSIKVGDLLVSSSKSGYAMKGTDRSRMLGAVIGKAMAKLDSGTGVIEVLVTLQ